MKKEPGFGWKLGMFVSIGLLLFVFTIYFVGRQRNFFGSTFQISSLFKTVNGLKEGNNVRFAGINVGTVNEIKLLTDTSVMVVLIIRKEVQQFIKTDATATIGSDGLMGDRVLIIAPGSSAAATVKNNDQLISKKAVDMDDIMCSVKASVDNAGIITNQLAAFSFKMNNGKGSLSQLISDEEFSNSLKSTLLNLQTSSNEFAKFTSKMNSGDLGKALDSTMANIQGATKGLNENMEAAKHNFLLRGYFKKKEKAALKKQEALKKEAALKQEIILKNELDSRKGSTIKQVINVSDSARQ